MSLLVVGAGGGIGSALLEQASLESREVWAVSSSPLKQAKRTLTTNLITHTKPFENWLRQASPLPSTVICCAGFLHTPESMPERRLSELSADFFTLNMNLNCLVPLRVAQVVEKLYPKQQPLKLILLSAMVGSIADNRLGGWYSYRMSKAALNMGVKNIAIEWARTRHASTVVAMHPGTTETNLSAPFRRGIGEGKLYSRQLTAARILALSDQLDASRSGELMHWDGSTLPY